MKYLTLLRHLREESHVLRLFVRHDRTGREATHEHVQGGLLGAALGGRFQEFRETETDKYDSLTPEYVVGSYLYEY